MSIDLKELRRDAEDALRGPIDLFQLSATDTIALLDRLEAAEAALDEVRQEQGNWHSDSDIYKRIDDILARWEAELESEQTGGTP